MTLSFNLEREGLYLQALRMPVKTHFGTPCQDDAISWKKIVPRFPHF